MVIVLSVSQYQVRGKEGGTKGRRKGGRDERKDRSIEGEKERKSGCLQYYLQNETNQSI